MANPELAAWAAGFFDGEGYCGGDNHRGIRCSISQVDRRVLDKFQSIVEVGNIYGPFPHSKNGNARPQYSWCVQNLSGIKKVFGVIGEYLGDIKRAQFHRLFIETANRRPPEAQRTHCPRGHEYAGNNLMRNKWGRHCKECNRLYYHIKQGRGDKVGFLGRGNYYKNK